jgi:hypothetical protein
LAGNLIESSCLTADDNNADDPLHHMFHKKAAMRSGDGIDLTIIGILNARTKRAMCIPSRCGTQRKDNYASVIVLLVELE